MKKILGLYCALSLSACMQKVDSDRGEVVEKPFIGKATWKTKFPSLWETAYAGESEPTPETVTYSEFLEAVSNKLKTDTYLAEQIANQPVKYVLLGKTDPTQSVYPNVCNHEGDTDNNGVGCLVFNKDSAGKLLEIPLDLVDKCRFQVVQREIPATDPITRVDKPVKIYSVNKVEKMDLGNGKFQFKLKARISNAPIARLANIDATDELYFEIRLLPLTAKPNIYRLHSLGYAFEDTEASLPSGYMVNSVFPTISMKDKFQYDVNYSCK